MEIGPRVRERRTALRLSQESLARQAGVTWSAIQRLEAGQVRDPHYSTLSGLANALGTTIADLVAEPEALELAGAGKDKAPSQAGLPPGVNREYMGEPEVMMEVLHDRGIPTSGTEVAMVSHYVSLRAYTPSRPEAEPTTLAFVVGGDAPVDWVRVMMLLCYVLETDMFTKDETELAAALRFELSEEEEGEK